MSWQMPKVYPGDIVYYATDPKVPSWVPMSVSNVSAREISGCVWNENGATNFRDSGAMKVVVRHYTDPNLNNPHIVQAIIEDDAMGIWCEHPRVIDLERRFADLSARVYQVENAAGLLVEDEPMVAEAATEVDPFDEEENDDEQEESTPIKEDVASEIAASEIG